MIMVRTMKYAFTQNKRFSVVPGCVKDDRLVAAWNILLITT